MLIISKHDDRGPRKNGSCCTKTSPLLFPYDKLDVLGLWHIGPTRMETYEAAKDRVKAETPMAGWCPATNSMKPSRIP